MQILKFNAKFTQTLVKHLPFGLTGAQRRATWEILQDLEKNVPMNRLLQGDVGSGKTIVAALAAAQTALNGHQTALLAPTAILATQHFESLQALFRGLERALRTTSSQGIKRTPKLGARSDSPVRTGAEADATTKVSCPQSLLTKRLCCATLIVRV